MRIVITGASGNVGTALLRRLHETDAGHELVGVVRRAPQPVGVYGNVQWHELDLSEPDSAQELRHVFEGADAVVHLAWGFQPTRNTDYLTRIGVGGTKSVLEAAHASRVGHLVHMSSVGTYVAGRYGERVVESFAKTGIRTSPYSRDKAAAEAVLDRYEHTHGENGVPIARMRPGFIVQRAAASGLMRYGLPAVIPMRILPSVPLLPIDRTLCIPLIHADDVADAFVRVIERRSTGAFNLAAEPPLRRSDVAAVLGARPVHVPAGLIGKLVQWSWRARLQPIDRGWIDLAFSVPLLDCSRARDELDWRPNWSSIDALSDVLDGISHRAYERSAPLRRRSTLDQLRRTATVGPITTRQLT